MHFRTSSLPVLLLLAAFLQQATARAQTPATAAASPEMDRLAKALAGDWDTVETMEPGDPWPQGASRKGSVKARLASGGYALVYEVHSDGSAGKLDGFHTIWWDQTAGIYYFVACFNDVEAPCKMRGAAHWEGDAFVNDYDVVVDGKKTPCRDTFTFTADSHKLVAAMASGGIMKTVITTNAHRVAVPKEPNHAQDSSLPGDGGKLSMKEFDLLMRRLERAWNANDAKLAADCFTNDAIYSSPPSPRIRQGRAALFAFFGGPGGRPRPMRMEWHNLLFDEAKQIGSGEYTFSYDIQTHGMVIVKIKDGKIANWREYEVESPASWDQAIGPNRF